MTAARRSFQRRVLPLLVIAWGSTVAIAWGTLWRFDFTPGDPAAPPLQWPARSAIDSPAGRQQLLLFLHPRCPCVRASIRELTDVLADMSTPCHVVFVFYAPAGVDSQWARGELWSLATALPGVEVREDRDGVEARRFGVRTSGQALLYDGQGALRLSAGLTASRGHAGPNPGRSALENLLRQRQTGQPPAAVFGCPLEGAKRNLMVENDGT